MHEYMELTFLGTGGSWPSSHRNVSAVGLKRGAEVLLFDCGEGTQRQFQKSNLSYMAVSRIFISHLHGDHVLGLPGLLATMGLNDREAPLEIYGPPGLKRLMANVTSPPLPRPGFPVHVIELEDGAELPFDGYTVHARKLNHSVFNLGYALVEDPRPGRFDKEAALDLGVPEGPAFGTLQGGDPVELGDGTVVTPDQVLGPDRRGRKVVYTGDCTPCEATVELAEGADLLVHEATYDASENERANQHGHSTSQQAAFMAAKAGVRRLFLTHISPRYNDPTPLLEEAQAIFEATTVARDLLTEVVRFPPDATAEAQAPDTDEEEPGLEAEPPKAEAGRA